MGIRIVHTGDWHLGKKLMGHSRLEEQELFIEWLSEYLINNNIDILLISGDIFDSPLPSNDALKLYFKFLKRTACSCFIIAGNHDSGAFLEAPLPFMEDYNITLSGKLTDRQYGPYTFTKKAESINIYLLPFFRQSELDEFINQRGHFSPETKGFNLLLAHHLFGENISSSGSEQVIHLSGHDSLPKKWFQQFDYCALGHMHNFQTAFKTPLALYPGSPIPFKFTEQKQKYVYTFEVKNNQIIEQEKVPIPCFRSLHSWILNQDSWRSEIEAKLKDLPDSPLTGFVQIILKSQNVATGVSEEIKNVLPQNLKLITLLKQFSESESILKKPSLDIVTDTKKLFCEYHKQKYNGADPENELMKTFCSLLERTYRPEIQEELESENTLPLS